MGDKPLGYTRNELLEYFEGFSHQDQPTSNTISTTLSNLKNDQLVRIEDSKWFLEHPLGWSAYDDLPDFEGYRYLWVMHGWRLEPRKKYRVLVG